VAIAVAYLVVPANEIAAEGPADPLLSIRRPVIKALIWAGILSGPGLFFDRFPYLPTRGGYEWSKPGSAGEYIPTGKVEVTKEPVYRGLLWPVGHRITYCRTTPAAGDGYCAVRLCYVEGSRTVVAAESPYAGPDARRSEVSGFVPSSARGFWVDCANDKGDVRTDAWGDCDPPADE
jgi:hypothetical protein